MILLRVFNFQRLFFFLSLCLGCLFNQSIALCQALPAAQQVIDQIQRQTPEIFLLIDKKKLENNLKTVFDAAARGEVVQDLPELQPSNSSGPNKELLGYFLTSQSSGEKDEKNVIVHIVGKDGKRIEDKSEKAAEEAFKKSRPPVNPQINFKLKANMAPVLDICKENKTVLVDSHGDKPAETLVDDLLIVPFDPPKISSEVFGSYTRIVRYKGGTDDRASVLMAQLGLPCVPFRIRNYKEQSLQDQGLNALANFDASLEKPEFHQFIKDNFASMFRGGR